MHALENEFVKLELDSQGLISSIFDKARRREIVATPGLWRIVYEEGRCQEMELLSKDAALVGITDGGGALKIVHESPVRVELTARLEGRSLLFDAELKCNANIVVREFQFPAFGMGALEGHELIWSRCAGERFADVGKAVDSCHTHYMGRDDKAVQMSTLYPGEAATNCFELIKGDAGLYFGSHDPSFQNTLHLMSKNRAGMMASLVKYPFLRKGESARLEGFVVALFKGGWHEGAKIYRAWADSWFKPPCPPSWVRNMNGWQRVILQHQYGETFFKYSDLERIYEDGAASGIDTIFMFGWHAAGHDSGYPHYVCDESQGGEAALKANIAKVRARGGKVILYFNGQLIDKSTAFYRETGSRISVKDLSGLEHTEVYPFGGAGTSLRLFGNKVFATACPACGEWIEALTSFVDLAVKLDVDSVFFDQWGFKTWPCTDASHGHPVPFMSVFAEKMRVADGIRSYVRERRPGMAFGTEWISDAMATNVDFIHGIIGGSGPNGFLEWFRYAFPEVVISDREIRDDTDIPRRVNHVLLLGLHSDVEIYRCRATVAETPVYAEYLAKACALRQELKAFLFEGRYLDVEPFTLSNPEIDASAFSSGDRMAVLLTQSRSERLCGELSLPGFAFERQTGIGEFKVEPSKSGAVSVELAKDSLAALIFKRR